MRREVRRTDTLRVSTWSALSAAIALKSLYSDGREDDADAVQIEEFASVQTMPLLPFVFFAESESGIDPRYTQLSPDAVESFSIQRVHGADKLAAYHHVLNIIGRRLRDTPSAMVTLTGCNADVGPEAGNTGLSQRRAEAVRAYLVNTWGIPDQRIRIESRNLPETAANPETSDGAQEHRRVEIASDNPAITAPIVTTEALRSATPPALRLRLRTERPGAIESWSVEILRGAQNVKTFQGKGSLPPTLDWDLDGALPTLMESDRTMTCRLTLIDGSGRTVTSSRQIDVQVLTLAKKRATKVADKELFRVSLAPFDVRSSEIPSANQVLVEQARGHLNAASIVYITGWADRSGKAEQNQAVAEARAKRTAEALRLPFNIQTMRGYGNAAIYDQNLPEGRMYTRAVDIVVERPVAP
ncbi:MAG: hypothetical protein FGM24_10950 [Candidatus Kapabacteria bacterium]|nr:hypothetical protein [Candidatus Kapabacteria bacterium]